MARRMKEEVQRDVQGFMRILLADPNIASLFLKSPQVVAKRFGITISNKDASRIKAALNSLVTGKIPVADDCSWHDFPECDHIARAVDPGKDVIRPDMKLVKARPIQKLVASDCSWHDFPECDHIARAINPGDEVEIGSKIAKGK